MKARLASELTIGATVMIVRSTNAQGHYIHGIRKGDWKRVTITEENISFYQNNPNGGYSFTPCK